ncbi:hypothetical protein AQJ11_37760 [Streptomyces corchorusii]|uniref:Uncharacterized protein n=1 Tax=Streptomyces corchorusii TaxID=1903 RepID=A0A101PTV4_STRCK|nr:hypothetical protein AQJ11_37760 [Streptomyces corchorusii]
MAFALATETSRVISTPSRITAWQPPRSRSVAFSGSWSQDRPSSWCGSCSTWAAGWSGIERRRTMVSMVVGAYPRCLPRSASPWAGVVPR